MTRSLAQKPRLGYSAQPTPERHVYIQAARKHHPTRHAWQLSHEEVRQVRAMAASDAVLYTIAAHFSVPRREVGLMTRRPFKLRADVPPPFETPLDAEARFLWIRDEVNAAHADAIQAQVEKDWTEAKREDRRRAKAAEKARAQEGA